MSTVTVAAVTIPNFRWATGSGTVYLRIYANAEFVTSDDVPIQSGSPLITGSWYKQLTCSLVGTDLTIPGFTIDSTTDALDRNGKSATYSAYFYLGNRQLGVYEGFESFRIIPQYATNPATWSLIRQDVANGVYVAPSLIDTYDRQTIQELIAQAVSMSSGVTGINGQTGPTIAVDPGTNISIVSAANTITIGITGTIAIGNGGTGSATAAGARSNLGAAASGANSDITALTGLTTPLGAAYGGTGQLGGYTVGDILYASGAAALSKLPDVAVGQVLGSGGVGVAPAYTANPSVTSITLSGMTAGRVLFAGAAGLVSDDSALLWDSTNNRLSVATTAADERINIGNASYIGFRNFADGATRKVLGFDASNVIQIASSGDAINLGGQVLNNISPSSDFSGGDSTTYHEYQNTPTASWFATRGTYVSNGAGNNFHFSSYVTTTGSRYTTAIFAEAAAKAAGSTVWGINPVAYTDTAGASPIANAIEANFGSLGTSATSQAFGMVIGAVGSGSTPAGKNTAFIQLQMATLIYPNARVANGIVFNDTVGDGSGPIAATGAMMCVAPGAAISCATGVDLAGGTFTAGAFNCPYGASNGIYANNSGSTGRYSIAHATTNATYGVNTLEIGDGDSTWSAIRFLAGETTEAFRLMPTLRAGFNCDTATLADAVHIRPTTTRVIADGASSSVQTVFGNPDVVGTSTAFKSDLRPGNTLRINGVNYTILDITDDTHLRLASNALSGLAGVAAYSNDPMFLIESEPIDATGDPVPFVEVDSKGTLIVYDNGAHESGTGALFTDNDGAIQVRDRLNPNRRLIFGYDDTYNQAYIGSRSATLNWEDLIIQGGSQTGYVGIGTFSPTALLTVEGSGVKTADFVGSQFNNVATCSTGGGANSKLGAAYTISGSWLGAAIGLRPDVTGGLDSSNNKTNYPALLHGGEVLVAPDLASSPVYAPTAMVHVVGAQTRAIAGTPLDAAHISCVNGNDTITGVSTTFNTDLVPGMTIRFGSNTNLYQIKSVTSNTVAVLTAAYGQADATWEEVWVDPPLIKAANGNNTTRFLVDSGGNCSVTHLAGLGGTPTTTAGAGAGTTPTISVSGSDTAGHLNVTTGTGVPASAQTVVTVNFALNLPPSTVPRVVLTPGNGNAAALSGNAQVYVDAASSGPTSWLVKVGSSGLASTTAYIWIYHVIY